MNQGIRSSSFNPIYNTNNDGNLIVEVNNIAPNLVNNSVITARAASTSSVLILAANPLRKTVLIFNDSTQILYLSLGTTSVSKSNFSIKLLPDGFTTFTAADYNGEVRGTWVGANGFARVTETT